MFGVIFMWTMTLGVEPPPKGTGWLREWRKENRASWGRGGAFRVFGRFFSCFFLSFLFIVISVILTIGLVSDMILALSTRGTEPAISDKQ